MKTLKLFDIPNFYGKLCACMRVAKVNCQTFDFRAFFSHGKLSSAIQNRHSNIHNEFHGCCPWN